jgi:wobble nucleotide-excising tRNase
MQCNYLKYNYLIFRTPHIRVTDEYDYNKLFFVIDDPISSMDFHYVYAVAQIIRNIKQHFDISKERYLILTHNIEFMSILTNNNIISNGFILENGQINNLNHNLIMPYEAHLRDVYQVSIRKMKPSHTTPNSIRHIMETINKFEKPDVKFEEYFNGIKEFKNNEFLYSLIQDCSHGRIRYEHPYTEETIINGCKCIIEFIKSKYQGQINHITKQ